MGLKLSKSGDNPYGDLHFHEVRGRNVVLQMNNEFARRAGGFDEGICFGSRPVRKGERVSLTVCVCIAHEAHGLIVINNYFTSSSVNAR